MIYKTLHRRTDIKTNNAMVKIKRHKDKQSMQWSTVKDKMTNNAMVKRKRYKDRQYNGQKTKNKQ